PPAERDFFRNYPPPVLKHSATPAYLAMLPSERRAHGLSGARDGRSTRDSGAVAGRRGDPGDCPWRGRGPQDDRGLRPGGCRDGQPAWRGAAERRTTQRDRDGAPAGTPDERDRAQRGGRTPSPA